MSASRGAAKITRLLISLISVLGKSHARDEAQNQHGNASHNARKPCESSVSEEDGEVVRLRRQLDASGYLGIGGRHLASNIH